MALTRVTDKQVTYKQGGTGSTVRNLGEKLRESVSVKDFGAVGDGVTDDTAAIQAAVTYAYAQLGHCVYFPTGTYLMSSTITMGNTAGTYGTYCHFKGEGATSVIKTTGANVNPFLWQGPNPDVDGAGNRIDGRILLEDMFFLGPQSGAGNTNSIGVKFYGVQGIELRSVTFFGWTAGEFYQNCDLINRYNVRSTQNVYGVNSTGTGFGLTSGGNMNSFNSYGGLVNNNSIAGIRYYGGIAPVFSGINFTANGTSIILSPNDAAGNPVTTYPLISGCYFEIDTSSTIILGGGSGIVRGPRIEGGFIICGSATPAILVSNASNSYGRGRISIGIDTGFAGSSAIEQATSAEKIDFYTLNDTPIGNITPSSAKFTALTLSANATTRVYAEVLARPDETARLDVYNNAGTSVIGTLYTSPTVMGFFNQGLSVGAFKDLSGMWNCISGLSVNTQTPVAAISAGVVGQITWDANYMYVCTATDSWKRVAIATW